MSEQAAARPGTAEDLLSVAAVAVFAAALAGAAHVGWSGLLVAVAALQAAAALGWSFGVDLPGRAGALVLAGLAAAGADVAVSLYPHARLQPLLPVAGLTLPAMFVHQLARRSRRSQVTASLGRISVLVCVVMAPSALLQLRAEFEADAAGAAAVTAVVLAAGCALVVATLVDRVLSVARFDADVRRGTPAVVAGTAVGAVVGYLALADVARVSAGAAAFAGAVLGALAALLAVAAAFLAGAAAGRRAGAVVCVLLPLNFTAPLGLLVLLAVRS